MQEFISDLSMSALYRMLFAAREELKLITDVRYASRSEGKEKNLYEFIDSVEKAIDHKIEKGE